MKGRHRRVESAVAAGLLILWLAGCGMTNGSSSSVENGQSVSGAEEAQESASSEGSGQSVSGAEETKESASSETEEEGFDCTLDEYSRAYIKKYAYRAELEGVTEDGKGYEIPDVYDLNSAASGSGTDGKYIYAIEKTNSYPTENPAVFTEGGRVYKIDPSVWEVVKVSELMPLGHCNDVAYNPKTGKLYVPHLNDKMNLVNVIDPETLEIVDTVELDIRINAIAYNETKDQWVVCLGGATQFSVLDADFQTLATYDLKKTANTNSQGIDCDDEYIYFLQFDLNSIWCYNWDGELAGAYYFNSTDYPSHVEALFHMGDDFYLSYLPTNTGSFYKILFDRSLLK